MKCETPFKPLPDAVVWDPSISSDAKVLYWALATFTARQGNDCFPRQDRIAEKLGWHRTKVCRAIGELQGRGYVDSKQRGHSLEYHLGETPSTIPLPSNCAAGAQQTNRDCAAGATESVQPVQLTPTDTSKRTKTIEQPPTEGRAPRQKKPDPSLTEEERARIVSRFAGVLGGDTAVRETITLALSHVAARKYLDTFAYVQNWLRRDAERKEQRSDRATIRVVPAQGEAAPAPTRPRNGLDTAGDWFEAQRAAWKAEQARTAADGVSSHASVG